MTNSTDLHICIFVPSLEGGGAEHIAVILANNLAKRSRVELVVAVKADHVYSKSVSGAVKINYLNKTRTLFALPNLISFLNESHPDIFLSIMDHSAVVAQLAGTLSNAKRTHFLVREAISVQYKGSSSLTSKLYAALVRWTYKKAAKIISPSEQLRQSLVEYYSLHGDKVVHVANPTITSDFTNKSMQNQFLPCPWDTSSITVIAAGRLVYQKDFLTLLQAFSLASTERDIKLVILGEGPLRMELEDQARVLGISDKVWFPGFVDNPLPFFRNSDLFVLTSRQEGLPNALIQALGCGTNVAATDCPTGPREILADVPTATLFDIGDYKTLSQVIRDASRDRLPSEVVSTIHAKYGEKEICAEYMNQMLDVINSSSM